MPPVHFVEPLYLWLLLAPVALSFAWIWRIGKRRRQIHRLLKQRIVPVVERYTLFGGLAFWGMVIIACALVIVALARPQMLTSVTQTAGVDFVVLQDGSTSMRVNDVKPSRWQRSVLWLRTFAGVLSWREERVALALFAHRAAPQVRLTSDPNALFFFLDHLGDESPFRLRDDTSWDTNIEDGIYWGVKMIDKDEELYGRRSSAKAFIVLSDGQSWSGEVDRALQLARARDIKVYVIGVGTIGGGFIPQLPARRFQEVEAPIHAVLDRRSLRAIAQAGGGSYFELGSESDQAIALKILGDVQRSSRGVLTRQEEYADFYWYCLAAAAVALGFSVLLLRERQVLWWQVVSMLVLFAVLLT